MQIIKYKYELKHYWFDNKKQQINGLSKSLIKTCN